MNPSLDEQYRAAVLQYAAAKQSESNAIRLAAAQKLADLALLKHWEESQ